MENNLHRKITSLVLFGFSLFYFAASFRLKMGTVRNPGPGLIPLAIGFLLLILTGVYLLRVFRAKMPAEDSKREPAQSAKNYRAVIGISLCTIGYPLILESLKFLTSTFVVGFAMLFLLKPQKPVSALLLALFLSIGSFIIFARLLNVALPSGFLENWAFQIGG